MVKGDKIILFLLMVCFVSIASATTPNSTYYFEQTSGVYIDSSSTVNATAVGGLTRNQQGIIGYGPYFPTTGNARVTLNSNAYYQGKSGDNAISLWFKTNRSTSTNGWLVMKDNGYIDANANGWGCYMSVGTIVCGTYNTNNLEATYYNATQLNDSTWHNLIFQFGSSGQYLYIDGISVANQSGNTQLSGGTTAQALTFGAKYRTSLTRWEDYFNGSIDNALLYANAITTDDVKEITQYPYVLTNNPQNNSEYFGGNTVNFNFEMFSIISDLKNITLYIDGSVNETKSTNSSYNTITFSKNFGIRKDYTWEAVICNNNNYCTSTGLNNLLIANYTINSASFNTTSYETKYESYILNISTDNGLTAVNLLYNGSSKAMTNQGNGIWSYSRDIPTSAYGNNSINFSFVYSGDTYYYTIPSYQYVNYTIFTLCNSSFTQSYINYSFKDETNNSNITASFISSFNYYLGSGTVKKTYSFTNTTQNIAYNFCTLPSSKTLYIEPSINYYASGYPTRIYEPSTAITLTNSTTNQILYLLSQNDGIYSTFVTTSQTSTTIIGASIIIIRTIGGSNVTVAQGTTDSAGSFTAWLNPNFDHYVTASKTGYGSKTVQIKPTQSSYTIQLELIANYSYLSNIAGLLWGIFPTVGVINNTNSRNYGFNVSSALGNLVACKIELLNNDKSVLLATGETNTTNNSYCTVEASYSINSTYPQVKGRLLVDIGNGYQILEEDAYWVFLEVNSTNMTLTDWFNDLKQFDLRYFNENEQHREYTQIFFFFLFVAIVCAGLNNLGWDIQTQGGMIYVVGFMIIMASIPGFLTLSGISPYAFIDKYFLAMVYTFFMIGFGLRNLG